MREEKKQKTALLEFLKIHFYGFAISSSYYEVLQVFEVFEAWIGMVE